jgi:DNA-binding NtrC family response regulator
VAELFGAERGAFTGAVQPQPGYFSAARGGTLFLDEIGEAPLALQATLLRALATGEIQRVGAQRTQRVEVRVIAATDADLEAKIRDGSFRAPLLHRLSSYEISLPPLRERRDDIGRLLVVFLREELARIGEGHHLADTAGDRPWLPTSLVARLAELDWPGNVRQLQNVARQVVIGSRGQDRVRHSPALERLLAEATKASSKSAASKGDSKSAASTMSGQRGRRTVVAPLAPEAPRRQTPVPAGRRKPAETTEEELAASLRAHRWDLAATAAALRLSRASVYVLIQRSPRLRTAGSLSAAEITRCFDECGGDVDQMVGRLEVSEKALRRRLRELGLPG